MKITYEEAFKMFEEMSHELRIIGTTISSDGSVIPFNSTEKIFRRSDFLRALAAIDALEPYEAPKNGG
jgi:hypothetical protein